MSDLTFLLCLLRLRSNLNLIFLSTIKLTPNREILALHQTIFMWIVMQCWQNLFDLLFMHINWIFVFFSGAHMFPLMPVCMQFIMSWP